MDYENLLIQCSHFIKRQFSKRFDIDVYAVDKEYLHHNKIRARELSWEIFYQFNHWIKVNNGIYDQNLRWDISGFTGRIIDFYKDERHTLFLISLSLESLNSIPVHHFQSTDFEFSPFYVVLASSFFTPLLSPDIVHDEIEGSIKKMMNVFTKSVLIQDNPVKNLDEFLIHCSSVFDNQLRKNEVNRVKTIEQKTIVWKNMISIDDKFGVWGLFYDGERNIQIPIADIETVIGNHDLNNILGEYKKIMNFLLPL